MITRLRKSTREGKPYKRDDKLEANLLELAELSRDDLVARCSIRGRDDPNYVPSECLLYFVRASRMDNSDAHFERLYKLLAERVLRALPTGQSVDGKTQSLTKTSIREKVFDRFTAFLAADRQAYSEKLDYFEVRFDGALASLRRDAQEQAWRDENRSTTIDYDDSGDLSAEVEEAVGSYDPFGGSEFDERDYRLRLQAAIDDLPPEQIRIVEMLRQGFPIDSKDPDVMTIAKALGRSEKTVRTHRDKAYAALRAALTKGGRQ